VVQPALDRSCIGCHDGVKGEKKLDLTATLDATSKAPASYRTLIQNGYVHYFNVAWNRHHELAAPMSFGTLKSSLFTILKDKDHEKVVLSPDDLQAIKCWIDLNCPLWGDYQNRDVRGQTQASATTSERAKAAPAPTTPGPKGAEQEKRT
jgi:hypothetical protein